MKRFKSIGLLAVCGLVGLAIYAKTDKQRDLPELNIDKAPIAAEVKAATSLAPTIKKASPSVVSIYSKKTMEFTSGRGLPRNPFFERFFGPDMFGEEGRPQRRESNGVGSGVIVSKDGYILTNNHVVEDADEIEVQFADGKTSYEAVVVGTDPNSDVAVIKIEAKDLPAIAIGDSDHLEVGDAVMAIGNPMNVGQTVTRGIVSAISRGGLGMVNYEDFIQTDAPINQGNSGGALIDAEGRLIGINTMIVSRSGGNNGIGFAIPSNMAVSVMNRLIQYGEMVRGYLGVQLQPLTSEIASGLGLDNPQGALAADVQPNTPAAKAGLEPGDVIIEFNGKKISDMRQLRLRVSETAPDTESTVKVIRDGKKREFKVTLEPFPEEMRMASFNPMERRRAPQTEESLKGVEVGDINRTTRQQFNIPAGVNGALVTDVDEDSAAYDAGLRKGDVIQQIQHKDVNSADDAVELSHKINKKQILLRVWSQMAQGSQFIVVDESKD